MGEFVDFKVLKSAVGIENVAARYGVGLRRMNGSHERGKCPLPTHPAGDDAQSFSINLTKQVWICHSAVCAKARRGKKGGDVIELVSLMENCSLRDAGLKLAAWYGVLMTHDQNEPSRDTQRPKDDPAPSETSTPVGEIKNGYGVYAPLAEWIELRMANPSIAAFEKATYMAVLGQIEELVRK